MRRLTVKQRTHRNQWNWQPIELDAESLAARDDEEQSFFWHLWLL
jgi:hypothetical protein